MRELSLSDTQQEVFLLQAAESFTETVNTPTRGSLGPAELRAVFWFHVTLESIVIMACAQKDRSFLSNNGTGILCKFPIIWDKYLAWNVSFSHDDNPGDGIS